VIDPQPEAGPVNVISKRKLRDFWAQYPGAEEQLLAWYRRARKATWAKWADVQRDYPRASYYKLCLVFNICGNAYRLVVRRSASWKTLFVVAVLTHAEYDLDQWKDCCD
jgi:mRNA interferase HigB